MYRNYKPLLREKDDKKEALKWFMRAAKQGNKDAIEWLDIRGKLP